MSPTSSALQALLPTLKARSAGCELCGDETGLSVHAVPPGEPAGAERCVLLCAVCSAGLADIGGTDINHWQCLSGSIWSEVPAVQVLSWRLLGQLQAHGWAADALAGAYLDEPVLAWAQAGAAEDDEEEEEVCRDSNGVVLRDGDAVFIIKDLNVKGAGFVAKRGTTVKNIRLSADPEYIEGRVSGSRIMLKTCFLKKLSG